MYRDRRLEPVEGGRLLDMWIVGAGGGLGAEKLVNFTKARTLFKDRF
jgi:hypothetical protein